MPVAFWKSVGDQRAPFDLHRAVHVQDTLGRPPAWLPKTSMPRHAAAILICVLPHDDFVTSSHASAALPASDAADHQGGHASGVVLDREDGLPGLRPSHVGDVEAGRRELGVGLAVPGTRQLRPQSWSRIRNALVQVMGDLDHEIVAAKEQKPRAPFWHCCGRKSQIEPQPAGIEGDGPLRIG